MRLLAAVLLILVLIFAVTLAATQHAEAGKPVSLYADAANGGTNIYNPVEQQSTGWQHLPDFCHEPREGIVCNRTAGCVWDVDDHLEVRWLGDYLKPGQSASYSRCLIGDKGHVYGFQQTHTLLLTITIELDDGPDFALSSRGTFCVGGPKIRDDSPVRESIPNSDGGTGAPGRVTFTVTNDSTRTERFGRISGIVSGSGNLGQSNYDGRWCPSGFPLVVTGSGGFDADGVGYWWSR